MPRDTRFVAEENVLVKFFSKFEVRAATKCDQYIREGGPQV